MQVSMRRSAAALAAVRASIRASLQGSRGTLIRTHMHRNCDWWTGSVSCRSVSGSAAANGAGTLDGRGRGQGTPHSDSSGEGVETARHAADDTVPPPPPPDVGDGDMSDVAAVHESGWVCLPSGLKYKDAVVGGGDTPKDGEKVSACVLCSEQGYKGVDMYVVLCVQVCAPYF